MTLSKANKYLKGLSLIIVIESLALLFNTKTLTFDINETFSNNLLNNCEINRSLIIFINKILFLIRMYINQSKNTLFLFNLWHRVLFIHLFELLFQQSNLFILNLRLCFLLFTPNILMNLRPEEIVFRQTCYKYILRKMNPRLKFRILKNIINHLAYFWIHDIKSIRLFWVISQWVNKISYSKTEKK